MKHVLESRKDNFFPCIFSEVACSIFFLRKKKKLLSACSHGSGGPQAGEVPHLGGVTSLSIQSLFFLDHVHILGGVPHQGGLPGQPVLVALFGGVSFLHVKVAEWGNPPNRGNQITVPKPAKTHQRTTWLPITMSQLL